MNSVEETSGRARLGRILGLIGYLWAALFFAARFIDAGGTPLGDILAFFGGNLFVPFALIFIGRGLGRRAESGADEEGEEAASTSLTTPPVLPGQERTQAPPPPPPPEPRPRPQPAATEPRPRPQPSAIEPTPRREPEPRIEPEPMVEPTPIPDFILEPGEFDPTYKGKSSEEMIAEAKKRLSRDP